jgi:hypothetical protein
MNQATSSIFATSIATIIVATNTIATTADLTIVIINTTIALVTTIRTQSAASPTKRRMIASAITSRKRATRPCTMTSPLCRARATCLEKGVALAQELLCALVLSLSLAQAAATMTTIM